MVNRRPDLVTVDQTVLHDLIDRCRPNHRFALRLLELADEGFVDVASAQSGFNYDVPDRHGEAAKRLQAIAAGITRLPQLTYVGEHTYPAEDLYPGAYVPAFAEAWNDVIAEWSTDRLGKKPGDNDRLHLETHILHRRDVFISDDGPLLTMCRVLADRGFEVDAVRVREYVSRHASQ